MILGAIWTFNMFNVVFLVSGGGPDGTTDILVSEAYRWAFTRQAQYGYAAAYSVLIFLLLMFGTRIPAALGALSRRRANNRAALAKVANERWPRIPVVVVTGDLTESRRAVLEEAQVVGILAKPYSTEELAGLLGPHLPRRTE